VVTVKVLKSEGSWKRPKRNLKINILLGGGAMVCLFPFIVIFFAQETSLSLTQLFSIQISTDGVDGEEIHLTMPSESEVSSLVATSKFEHKKRMGISHTTYLWLYCFRSRRKDLSFP
jgi:alpha-glucosidase